MIWKSNISWYLAPDQGTAKKPTPKITNDQNYETITKTIIFYLGDEIVCINTQIVHGKTVDEGNHK